MMTIEQILVTIQALIDANTDEQAIKKMLLQMLAEDTGADVSVPAGDAGMATPPAMATEAPPGQGATPGQTMAARNPRPAAATPAPASYAARPTSQGSNLALIAELVGRGIGVAMQTPSRPATPAPASYAARPAATTAPGAKSQAESLLEDTLFMINERAGLHAGQNPVFLKKLLKSDLALYSEAIASATPITHDAGGSPAPVRGASPLANTGGGQLAERNALAAKIKAYREQVVASGKPCTWNQAMTAVLESRGPAR